MKLNINILLIALSFSCTLLLTACKKELDNPSELFLYVPSGSLSYNSSTVSYAIARGKIFEGTGIAFPVLLTRAFGQDVQVTATIDTSLLAEYDRINKTKSPEIPAGAFLLKNNGQIRIPAGQERSADSVQLSFGDGAANLDFTKQYVVPIRLISTNANVPLSTNRQVMYMRVTFNRIMTQLSDVPTNRLIPIIINRTPSGDVIKGNLNISAAVNTAFSQNLSVALQARPDLLAGYNQTNQTNYLAFPANTFTFNPASVSISGGSLKATMLLSLVLSNSKAFEPGKSYLLPVGIADEGLVAPHETQGVAYYSVDVQIQNINPDNPTPSGTRVDRSGWTAIASSTDTDYAPGEPELAFDNDAATGWQSEFTFGTQPAVQFTIDMHNQKSIRGFTFTPKYWSFFGSDFISAVTKMEVASSNDGINWTPQGSYAGSMPNGTAANPELRNVSFYAPIQARYFRFNITGYGVFAAGFGELNAFE
ncbi:BT_3987 domain-containing protein [Sphingobacterium spiritivorum]|uniref:BT_3987 domain-containing protein n=1 Tax=Sphingobacterium spiritivorum TaxID=258 RepID=UPI003DA5C843